MVQQQQAEAPRPPKPPAPPPTAAETLREKVREANHQSAVNAQIRNGR